MISICLFLYVLYVGVTLWQWKGVTSKMSYAKESLYIVGLLLIGKFKHVTFKGETSYMQQSDHKSFKQTLLLNNVQHIVGMFRRPAFLGLHCVLLLFAAPLTQFPHGDH